MNTSTLVQKLWNYCNVLRDDGLSYGDYVEQLTYLLFLKMADERSRPPYNEPSLVPDGLRLAQPAAQERATSCSTTTATPWKPWARGAGHARRSSSARRRTRSRTPPSCAA
ncbi:MAG: type I restriction-modification system subunit M N-terminal domain-containing protein [Burkholderiaceae bacterium]|nr:type I restriction-modification system subunit M N-terminal domain-containing protein [Burkholderiaceae bacterium]